MTFSKEIYDAIKALLFTCSEILLNNNKGLLNGNETLSTPEYLLHSYSNYLIIVERQLQSQKSMIHNNQQIKYLFSNLM